MAVGEDDATLLIDNEAGGVACCGRLSVERAASGGAEDDDSRDHFVERPSPVLSGGDIFPERRRVDLHAQILLHS